VDSLIEDVRIEHGRSEVTMTQEFLDGPDIMTRFEQVCCKTVPESMASDPFNYSCR